MVLGHRVDLVHRFTDPEDLAHDLTDARQVAARAIFELRPCCQGLVAVIYRLLGEMWAAGQSMRAA
jgi:hypothetical protein